MTQTKKHFSFWVIGGIALIWYAMGVMNLVMQTNPEMVANYPESHRQLIQSQPFWAYGGFVMSVVGGLIGALLMLLGKPACYVAFLISLFGTVMVMAHTLTSGIEFSGSDIVLTIVSPLLVAGFLVWYARVVIRKGWVG